MNVECIGYVVTYECRMHSVPITCSIRTTLAYYFATNDLTFNDQNTYRTDCFAAVIISIVATMQGHWDMAMTMTTVPQPLRARTTTAILTVLLRKKHRAVTLVKNIVQIYEPLRLVLGLIISVTLWGVTRLKLLGIEQRRTALTFLDTFETFLQ